MEQYFTSKPQSKDNHLQFTYVFQGKTFHFRSNNGVFSKNAVDFGTTLLMEAFVSDIQQTGILPTKIADAGCGIGVVGSVLGKLYAPAPVCLFDVNERALTLAKQNTQANGATHCSHVVSDLFSQIHASDFSHILTNPPIRAGKQLIFKLYEQAHAHLLQGGAFYVVIQKKQGADSTLEKLKSIFGNAFVLDKKAGYRIIKSIKGSV